MVVWQVGNVIVATLLSMFYAGLGQVYNGQWKKGVVYGGLYFSLALSGVIFSPLFQWVFWLCWLVSLIDAYMVAYKNKDDKPEFKLKNIKFSLILLVSFCLVSVVHITVIDSMERWMVTSAMDENRSADEKKVTKETEKHLQEKYHQPFVVTGVKYIKDGDSYQMVAHPKEDPDFNFAVIKLATGQFSDSYANLRWSKELEKEVSPLVNNSFGAKHVNLVSIVKTNADRIDFDKLPSYSTVRSQIDDINQNIRIYVIKDVSNPDEEASNIYNFIKSLRDKEIAGDNNTSITVEYYDDSVLDDVDRIGLSNAGQFIDQMNVRFSVTRKELIDIQSTNDVSRTFIFVKENK